MKIPKSPIKIVKRQVWEQNNLEQQKARQQILDITKQSADRTAKELDQLIGFEIINTLALLAIAIGLILTLLKLKKLGL